VPTALETIMLEGNLFPRILIVDDNPQIHRDFEIVLLEEPADTELDIDEQLVFGVKASPNKRKDPSYILDHAYSGMEGIEKVTQSVAKGQPYQLAFVDIRMPGLDGVETIARIWQIDPKIQMIICTAYADYSQEDLVHKLGYTDKLLVLKKPFDSIEVTQLARTLAEKWHLALQSALKLEQMELLVSQRTQKILDFQRREFRGPAELELSDQGVVVKKPAIRRLPLILIVENNNNASNQRIGQTFGDEYEIIVAKTHGEGLERAIETVPDLVIVDTSAAGIHGTDLCRKLKAAQLTNHIPVIMLASGGEEEQLKALEAGADDYIIKPFDGSVLQARIENLLESRRKLRSSFRPKITLQPRDLAINQADARFLHRTMMIIEQNMSDFEFDVDALAQKAAVSRRQLFRKLKAIIDTTPKTFIRSVRLKRAAELLLESEMTITEITFAVGFQDVKHFRALFKAQFGVLPSEYMKEKK
jgi:CheY-like chemotaxis protein/AraC-like DNA-binding protein